LQFWRRCSFGGAGTSSGILTSGSGLGGDLFALQFLFTLLIVLLQSLFTLCGGVECDRVVQWGPTSRLSSSLAAMLVGLTKPENHRNFWEMCYRDHSLREM
jgi:hypothetical protein